MNKAQKIIISVALIIMGLLMLLYSHYSLTEGYVEEIHIFFMSLLGFAFIVSALVILFNFKKKR